MVAMSARACPILCSLELRAASFVGVEKVERPDGFVAESHRHRMDGAEAGQGGGLSEFRPSVPSGFQVLDRYRTAAADALDTRALLGLHLQQFEEPGLLAGGRDEVEAPSLVDEQQSDLAHVEELDAGLDEVVEEVDDVVVVDEGVGKDNEALCENGIPLHICGAGFRLVADVAHSSSFESRRTAADKVGGQVVDRQALYVRNRAKTQHGLLDGCAQLHHRHAGRLVHHHAVRRFGHSTVATRRR